MPAFRHIGVIIEDDEALYLCSSEIGDRWDACLPTKYAKPACIESQLGFEYLLLAYRTQKSRIGVFPNSKSWNMFHRRGLYAVNA